MRTLDGRNRNSRRVFWTGFALLALLFAKSASSQTDADLNYANAIASPVRTDADRKADAGRKPLEFLRFTRIEPGMRVLDLSAGAGYTTQLLALATGATGHILAQTPQASAKLRQRLADHPQPNISLVLRSYDEPVPPDVTGLDLVTIVLSYHDIAYLPVDRAKMDRALFAALRPGGHLVIIDHSARDGSGASDSKTLHRIDEALVRKELEGVGFRLEEESNFLRNPADPRDHAFFDTNIVTDKFALRFVK